MRKFEADVAARRGNGGHLLFIFWSINRILKDEIPGEIFDLLL